MQEISKASAAVRQRRAQIREGLKDGSLSVRAVLVDNGRPVRARRTGVPLPAPEAAIASLLLTDVLKMTKDLSRLRLYMLGELALADGINLAQEVGRASDRARFWLAALTDRPVFIRMTVAANLDARQRFLDDPSAKQAAPYIPRRWVLPRDDHEAAQ